jgi:hypothetical protein
MRCSEVGKHHRQPPALFIGYVEASTKIIDRCVCIAEPRAKLAVFYIQRLGA